MKQITEDYVSFEIAKLLKEKGFPQDYDKYHGLVYNEEDYEDEYEIQRMVLETRQVKAGTLHSYPLGVPKPKCYCPTHQMTLKWLREVHNIHIEIRYIPSQFTDEPTYKAMIWNMDTEIGTPLSPDISYTYFETCVEAALKYTLENLI